MPTFRTEFDEAKILETNIKIAPGVIIEPGAIIHNNVNLEHHVVIGPNSIVKEDTHIACGTIIGELCHLGGHNIIGANTTIHAMSYIVEGMTIGSRCHIGPRFTALNTSEIGPTGSKFGRPNTTHMPRKPPHIAEGARIGGAVTLVPGVRIGRDTLIDAGALITKDVPDGIRMRSPGIVARPL